MAFQGKTNRVQQQFPSPEELYLSGTLPRTTEAVDGLWLHQGDVIRADAEHHQETPDLALELPTGSGKTLPGLLIAEWVRRKSEGPRRPPRAGRVGQVSGRRDLRQARHQGRHGDFQQQHLLMLKDIQDGAASVGIKFNVEWDETIHDRSITTDNGWKILLGRGLDIFQKGSGSQFDMGARRQEFRQVVAFGVTYINEGKGA